MANAKRCDRCKEYYDDNSKYQSRVRKEAFLTGVLIAYGPQKLEEEGIDLCDDCLTALHEFLEMRR